MSKLRNWARALVATGFIVGAFEEDGGMLSVSREDGVQSFRWGNRAAIEIWATGGYVAFLSQNPLPAVNAVPEPNSLPIVLLSLLLVGLWWRPRLT